MTPPRQRIGQVYRDADGRLPNPDDSDLRKRTLERLRDMREAAWETVAEDSIRTLLAVMDWHKPWTFYEQVFRPTYIGSRYLGPGCRSCGPSSAPDCMTVRTIAEQIGVPT